MSEAFAILSGALDEAIKDTRTKKLKRTVRSIEIEPAGVYSSVQVKNIREKIGLTQKLFAKYLGVSTHGKPGAINLPDLLTGYYG